MSNRKSCRTIFVFALLVLPLLFLSSPSFAVSTATCQLNFDQKPTGGLYSGTLVDASGQIVGTCIGSAPRTSIVLSSPPRIGDRRPERTVPTVCFPAGTYLDCSRSVVLGDLHNQALRAVLGTVPPRQNQNTASQMPTVQQLINRLVPWLKKTPALWWYHREDDRKILAEQITRTFRAAGFVTEDGRFIRQAFKDPRGALRYLEKNGTISPKLSETIFRLYASNAPLREYRVALNPDQWEGQDIIAAAIFDNVITSSTTYFGLTTYPGPSFWDALGALLLFETGPGAIAGGYVMSVASCGCTGF
jgi:hypothetical protein